MERNYYRLYFKKTPNATETFSVPVAGIDYFDATATAYDVCAHYGWTFVDLR